MSSSSNTTSIPEPRFSWLRSIRLGTFHIGSSFADILGSSIWNYVMANGLGAAFAATPVALLLALRQLLVPLTLLAGHLSDTRPILGYFRLPYIWLGRGLMLLALPVLPVATTMIFDGNLAGWALATIAFIIFGVGTQLSGSPFTALVRDSAPAARAGVAYAVVQTMLVAAFAFSPLVYARVARAVLPVYNPDASGLRQYNLDVFWLATALGCGIALFAWIFSVIGVERRNVTMRASAGHESLGTLLPTFKTILADPRTRNFFALLALGATSGFAQDGILEPSLRLVFGYGFGEAQGVIGVWGVGLLLALVGCIGLTRKWPTVEQVRVARIGLVLSTFSLGLMAYTFATRTGALVMPAVFAFGLGFGTYTAGGSPLLMVMARSENAGAYLGLWSMAQLLFRGIGVALGGIIYDVTAVLSGSIQFGYATVYALEAVGFALCLIFLGRADVRGFASNAQAPRSAALSMLD
jgi:BCD family chlorophyll transporter-like MFS transporter